MPRWAIIPDSAHLLKSFSIAETPLILQQTQSTYITSSGSCFALLKRSMSPLAACPQTPQRSKRKSAPGLVRFPLCYTTLSPLTLQCPAGAVKVFIEASRDWSPCQVSSTTVSFCRAWLTRPWWGSFAVLPWLWALVYRVTIYRFPKRNCKGVSMHVDLELAFCPGAMVLNTSGHMAPDGPWFVTSIS